MCLSLYIMPNAHVSPSRYYHPHSLVRQQKLIEVKKYPLVLTPVHISPSAESSPPFIPPQKPRADEKCYKSVTSEKINTQSPGVINNAHTLENMSTLSQEIMSHKNLGTSQALKGHLAKLPSLESSPAASPQHPWSHPVEAKLVLEPVQST